MGLRDWLAEALGRRAKTEAAADVEPEALDLRPDFLDSLLGTGSAADYRRLEADRQAARNEIPDIESYVENLEWFRDHLLPHLRGATRAFRGRLGR